MCTIIIAVPKHRSAFDVALAVRSLRPKVYDYSLVGYRQLDFTVAERGKEVHMTIQGVTGNDATNVFGQVNDDLYSHQLSCVLYAPVARAA
jgi:hypothetical protein